MLAQAARGEARDIPREREVYESFKDYSRTKPVREAGIEALVKEIRAFARYFCALALGTEQNATLSHAFHDLRELKVDVAYPLLLELYHEYANNMLSATDFAAAVRLVEAYVFRRAICAIPTNSMNKTFGTFGKALKKDRYLERIQGQGVLSHLQLPLVGDSLQQRGMGEALDPARSADAQVAGAAGGGPRQGQLRAYGHRYAIRRRGATRRKD